MRNKVGILTIGDELLIGQIVNTNAAWIGNEVRNLGMEVTRTLTVGDKPEEITWGLNKMSEDIDYMFITGGLGPTEDDQTKHSIAEYFNDHLIFNEELYQRAVNLLAIYGRKPLDSQRRQCMLPSKARIFQNDLGTAPGMYLKASDKHYFFLPGVPFEMRHLIRDRILNFISSDILDKQFPILTKTILTASVGETLIENNIADIVKGFPRNLNIAYLPGKGIVRLRLSWRGDEVERGTDIIENYRLKIQERLGNSVYGYDQDTLEMVVGRLLLERGLNLVTAESCTGGKIASRIVSIAGSSRYYNGGVVTYSNDLKEKMLGVHSKTLKNTGAVSEACASEMAEGALNKIGGDIALSITGIAGPEGGTEEKPVGTVYIGVASKDKHKTIRYRGTKNREINIEYFANQALNLLRLFILGL